MAIQQWTVGGGETGLRLDKFLAADGRAGSRLRAIAALERGKVSVNGADVTAGDAGRRLAQDDVVALWVDRPGTARKQPRARRSGDLDILFEDDHLLAVNKPAGLLAVPLERRGQAPSVRQLAAEHLRSHGKRRPLSVHRIDEDTTGIVLLAKHADAQRSLQEQFKRQEPERVYLTVVQGRVEPGAGTWRDRLAWNERALIQRAAAPGDPRARDAICHFTVLERFRDASLLEVRLGTGRRNQIRAQAMLHGHPLVGEPRYVSDAPRPRIAFGRQALHAWKLTVRHPVTGRTMTLEAPLPPDMNDLIERLRRVR
jgi:23S rRNA pseudouridine1911/1915/1917 synthase